MASTHYSLLLDEQQVPLQVRRIRGARRMRLHWQPLTRSVLLTLPPRASLREGLRFAESRKSWVAAQLARHGGVVCFADGAVIPVFGEALRIEHLPGLRGVEAGQGVLRVGGDAEFLSRRVQDWLKRRMRAQASALAADYAGQLGVRVRKVTLRDGVSRWGSCSSAGNLSFSWRLVLAQLAVFEYIVAHEVAHLRHMDHSPAFWRVVRELCPDYKAPHNWLKVHGKELYRYGG